MGEIRPYDLIRSRFAFPKEVEDRGYQIEAINKLAPLSRSGWYAEPCTGKTFMATAVALYKKATRGSTTIVLMPPILVKQWYLWLQTIPGVTSVMYRGKPAQRKEIPLDRDFTLMSIQIFKRDFEYLSHMLEHKDVVLIVDEATSIKNVGSQNYKRTRDFSTGRDLMLLTGTPLSTPADAYAYVKLVAPTIYRNQRHFESLHVEERDFFDNVTRWGNLDFLAENMLVNSVRILKKQALPHLKEPIYVPLHYELHNDHYALYKKLAEEQLLLLEDGGKIDATTASKLYNCLQQIVCNPGHFSGDPNMGSAAHELLDAVLDEIGASDQVNGSKLMVVANYKMTHRGLLQYLQPYGAVACYGEVSQAAQQRNLDRFRDDPSCRVLCVQPISAGYGLEGLQRVCADALVLETPIVPRDFTQVVDRLFRDKQLRAPNIRIAIADNTIQPRLHNRLLNKDALVHQVQGGWKDLREAIYGKV